MEANATMEAIKWYRTSGAEKEKALGRAVSK
jgi:hypothetical protein